MRYRPVVSALALALGAWTTLRPTQALGQVMPKATRVPPAITIWFEGGLASEHYGAVLSALGRARLVPMKPVLNTEGLIPERLLAREGALVGATVASELDVFLCEQNPHICVFGGRDAARRTVWFNGALTSGKDLPSVEGSVCPRADLPTYVFCLPDVRIQRAKTISSIHYNAQVDDLQTIVGNTGGCLTLDETCEGLIRAVNPGKNPLSKSFSGLIAVPTSIYGMRIRVISAEHLERTEHTLDTVIQARIKSGRIQKERPNLYYTLTSPVAGSTQASSLHAQQPSNSPLDANIPLRTMGLADDVPDPQGPTELVGVWDKHVDTDHCALVGAIALAEPLPEVRDPQDPQTTFPRFPDCQTMIEKMRSDKWDHGTHVAGIVAARPHPPLNIRGVNPLAKVWAYEYRADRLEGGADPDPFFRLLKTPLNPIVINMSFTESVEAAQTRLRELITRWEPAKLVVAAAGTLAKTTGTAAEPATSVEIRSASECQVFPACLSLTLSNVISVVALHPTKEERLPDPPEGNYYWGTAFDVGAAGEALGPFHGNSFGPMAGNSVASAFVSGLATLIQARAATKTLTPSLLKQRILYTSDFSANFEPLVRFGRINFARALEVEHDVLALKDQAGGERLLGVSQRRGPDYVVKQGYVDGKPIDGKIIPQKNVRRLVSQSDGELLWVVFLEDGILKKASEVSFQSTPTLSFKPTGKDRRPYAVINIKDFTCSLDCLE